VVRAVGAATLKRAADCELFRRVTVIDVLPEIVPTLAVIVALPVLLAANVTGLPGSGVKVPTAGETDQRGVTETELPYRSCPVAAKRSWPPTRTWVLVAVTEIVASGAALTVSVCVASPKPLAPAVSSGCPARESL
jgi:hypothetical protein